MAPEEEGRGRLIPIDARLALREEEITESFVRASGPGGQNVNKVSTAVRLSFDLRHSPSLPPAVKARAARLAGHRLTSEGVVVIAAQRFRSLERNREDALERLLELLREAAVPPVPRIATRVPKGEKRRRVEGKVRRGEVKRLRGKPAGD